MVTAGPVMTWFGRVSFLSRSFFNSSSFRQLWHEIWQRNERLEKRAFHLRVLVRLTKAVCTFSFWYGWKTSKDLNSQAAVLAAKFDDVSRRALASVKTKRAPPNGASKIALALPCLCTTERDLNNLRRVLSCIRRQTLKPCYTFLVDDGSPTPIAKTLTECEREGITLLRLDTNCGPATARNTGLRAARRSDVKYVCFTDADCLPSESWVKSIVEHFERNLGDDIVSGFTTSIRQTSFVETFHDCFGTLNGPRLPDQTLLYGPTCNLAVRLKTVLVEFNPRFQEAAFEDVEFCLQARNAGAVLRLVPNMIVRHDYDITLLGAARQFARYGRGFSAMNQIHPSFPSLHLKSRLTPVPF